MNKLMENLRIALASLVSSKLRAALTTLGIGIGISAVIILVTLGEAVQVYVNEQFLSVGSDVVYVRPTSTQVNSVLGPARVSTGTITEDDMHLLQDSFNVPNVSMVVPLVSLTRNTEYGSSRTNGFVSATTPGYFDVLSRTIESGRGITEEDVIGNTRFAVLGQTTVKNLFPPEINPLGETIRLGGVPFRVIGVLAKYGGSSFGRDQDDIIIVPLGTAHTHLNTTRTVSGKLPLSTIYLKATSMTVIDGIVKDATDTLHRAHRIRPGKDDDFTVSTQQDVISSVNAVLGVLTIFLAVIGSVSLLVGGIGVMNIMLVTVTERTREIGLRKAVGARAIDVLLQFLIEALVLCFVGAFAGLILAYLFTSAVAVAVPDLSPSITLQSIVVAVGVTSAIGLFFGIYPANRAARLSPITALRFE